MLLWKGIGIWNVFVEAANGIECSGQKESGKGHFHPSTYPVTINPTHLPIQSSLQWVKVKQRTYVPTYIQETTQL